MSESTYTNKRCLPQNHIWDTSGKRCLICGFMSDLTVGKVCKKCGAIIQLKKGVLHIRFQHKCKPSPSAGGKEK